MANYAAVSLHNEAIRYLELTGSPGNFKVAKSVELPITRGWGNLSGALMSLRPKVVRFPPVSFGVPVRETMIRLIEYHRMPIEDAKQALQFDFESYFTWPYSETAVDACEVESPVPPPTGKMSMLVAVCRNEIITQILEATGKDRLEIKLEAIEPMSIALLRAVAGPENKYKGAWYSLCAEPDAMHFALMFNGNGVFYRFGSPGDGVLDLETEDGISAIIEEVQKTVTFVGNQFRGISPKGILLSGLFSGDSRIASVIESATSLGTEFVDIYSQWGVADAGELRGFESALGLCLRNLK